MGKNKQLYQEIYESNTSDFRKLQELKRQEHEDCLRKSGTNTRSNNRTSSKPTTIWLPCF